VERTRAEEVVLIQVEVRARGWEGVSRLWLWRCKGRVAEMVSGMRGLREVRVRQGEERVEVESRVGMQVVEV